MVLSACVEAVLRWITGKSVESVTKRSALHGICMRSQPLSPSEMVKGRAIIAHLLPDTVRQQALLKEARHTGVVLLQLLDAWDVGLGALKQSQR